MLIFPPLGEDVGAGRVDGIMFSDMMELGYLASTKGCCERFQYMNGPGRPASSRGAAIALQVQSVISAAP